MVALDTFPTSRGDVGEEKWGSYMGRLVSSGVVRGPYALSTNGDLKVYADSTGMQSKVGPGVVVINGTMAEATGITVLSHAAAHASQHRYDRIVARLSTVSPYTIEVISVTGSTSGTQNGALAAMQALTTLDVELGYVYIAPAASSISAGNATPRRTWAGAAGLGQWFDYTPVLNTASGSTFTISSSSFARARARFVGTSLEVSIGGLVALAGGGGTTGGLTISTPAFARNTQVPLSADAFNDTARCRTATVGGVTSFIDLYPPAGHTWPADTLARTFAVQGSFEVLPG